MGNARAMVRLAIPTLSELPLRPRVEILGVFGSGKTTLAKRIAPAADDILPEAHEHNPFWGDARALAITGYLAYDVHFLVQHAYLATRLSPASSLPAICDWSLMTDRLWASLRLGEELLVYEQVYAAVTRRVGTPIGYLYLRHPPALIAERIAGRGRAPESKLLRDVERAAMRLDQLAQSMPADSVAVVGDDLSLSDYETLARRWLGLDQGGR